MRRHPHPVTWCALAAAWSGLLVAASCTPERPLTPPARTVTVPVPRSGDDDRDGRVEEDETGWRCDLDGNRQCSPGAVRST